MCTLGVPPLLLVVLLGCTCWYVLVLCVVFVSTCLRMLGVYHHHVPLPSQLVILVGGQSGGDCLGLVCTWRVCTLDIGCAQ
jgi:hypothetical protein